MTITVSEIDDMLRRRRIGPAVRERILRLNPNGCEEGTYLRGWHPSNRNNLGWNDGCISKGSFLRMHSHDEWERLPRSTIRKSGKRAYVAREAVLDRVWLT